MAKRSWKMSLLASAIALLPWVSGAEPEVAHKDLIDAMNAGRGTGPTRIPKELPQDGALVLKSGDYKLLVEPARAFTISECFYRDARIIVSAGAQGTVILTQQAHRSIKENTITEKDIWGDPWIGTAHGGEIVHEVTLTVDGKARPLATGTDIRGDRIVLEKVTTQYKFENRTGIVLTPEGFEEHRELRAKEDVDSLHYFYLFMLSWPATTEKYLAGFPDGSERTEAFGENRSIQLGNPRWYAQYDPTLKLGIVQFTPDAAPGPAFVQVRKNYHKHYTQFGALKDKVFKSGELIKRTVFVRVFADPTGDWSVARKMIAELEKRTSADSAREAVAIKAATPPTIDGVLDDEVWQRAAKVPGAALSQWVTMAEPHQAIRHARTAYVAYDATNLYVALVARVEDTERLDCRSDRPELGDCLRVDFRGSATGVDCEGNNPKIIFPYILPVTQAAVIGQGEWTAEIAIPWTAIPGRPEPSQRIPFNVTGHDYLDGFVTWAPVSNERNVPNFGGLKLAP